MKRIAALVIGMGAIVVAGTAFAQQAPKTDDHQHSAQSPAPGTQRPAPAPGTQRPAAPPAGAPHGGAQGGMHGGMQGGMPMMMCPMMHAMMHNMMHGGGMQGGMNPMTMMGMMGGDQMDAKTRGQMMQMHGEMMKAMGDILTKHGKTMEGQPTR